MGTVLVVDDDRKLVEMLRRTLEYDGHRVITAGDGHTAIHLATSEAPDVVVLDWMLPGADGMEVLRRLRPRTASAVLMLTARDEIDDRVDALDAGADDYLPKPFAPDELLARVRALLRRGAPKAPSATLAFADIQMDPTTRAAHRGPRSLELTSTECRLLAYFLRHPRQVLTRDSIFHHVWGPGHGGTDNLLEVYIGYLRSKTEAGGEPRLIHTVRGVGYVLRRD